MKNVLVVGTGTIGEPLIGLLTALKKDLEIDDVYFYKRTPLVEEVPKVNSLRKKGAKLAVTDLVAADKFNVLGNCPNCLFEEALDQCDVIIDCTPAGNQNKKEIYSNLEGKTFIAQGSEKGFGVPYAYGINDDILKQDTTHIQVVSCNTHNIACLLKTIPPEGVKDIVKSDIVCIRRANDVSQDQSFVASPTVGNHTDSSFGTHHARDVRDLFATINEDVKVFSSAMKLNTQYMHSMRFSIEVVGAIDKEGIISRLENNKFVAMTHKDCANKIFSFGRDHGFYGRIYNQTVVSIETLHTFYDSSSNTTTVTGFCFTPQDGNSLLSSAAAALFGLYGANYESYLDNINQLLCDRV